MTKTNKTAQLVVIFYNEKKLEAGQTCFNFRRDSEMIPRGSVTIGSFFSNGTGTVFVPKMKDDWNETIQWENFWNTCLNALVSVGLTDYELIDGPFDYDINVKTLVPRKIDTDFVGKKMTCQVIYDWVNTGYPISGEDMHYLFRELVGEPSPRGAVLFSVRKLQEIARKRFDYRHTSCQIDPKLSSDELTWEYIRKLWNDRKLNIDGEVYYRFDRTELENAKIKNEMIIDEMMIIANQAINDEDLKWFVMAVILSHYNIDEYRVIWDRKADGNSYDLLTIEAGGRSLSFYAGILSSETLLSVIQASNCFIGGSVESIETEGAGHTDLWKLFINRIGMKYAIACVRKVFDSHLADYLEYEALQNFNF